MKNLPHETEQQSSTAELDTAERVRKTAEPHKSRPTSPRIGTITAEFKEHSQTRKQVDIKEKATRKVIRLFKEAINY